VISQLRADQVKTVDSACYRLISMMWPGRTDVRKHTPRHRNRAATTSATARVNKFVNENNKYERLTAL